MKTETCTWLREEFERENSDLKKQIATLQSDATFNQKTYFKMAEQIKKQSIEIDLLKKNSIPDYKKHGKPPYL